MDVAESTSYAGKANISTRKADFITSDGRYYSPETKRYVDAGAPETALANATTIYGLNLQNSTLTNPVNEIYNGYTNKHTDRIDLRPSQIDKVAVLFKTKIFAWYNNLHWGWKVGIANGIYYPED